MQQYKHYSFDLWGTLLKPNPKFTEARQEYFFDHFNRHKKSHLEIDVIFKTVKDVHNATAEITGKGFTPSELYTMVLYFLGYDMNYLTMRDIVSIYSMMQTLFLKYPPHLIDDTGSVLFKLKSRGATLSVLSNTGFASGATMRQVLDDLNLRQFFQFVAFSDETGTSKPNLAIYHHMIQLVLGLNANAGYILSDIAHVGDNMRADVSGANTAGITGIGVHMNGITLKNIL